MTSQEERACMQLHINEKRREARKLEVEIEEENRIKKNSSKNRIHFLSFPFLIYLIKR